MTTTKIEIRKATSEEQRTALEIALRRKESMTPEQRVAVETALALLDAEPVLVVDLENRLEMAEQERDTMALRCGRADRELRVAEAERDEREAARALVANALENALRERDEARAELAKEYAARGDDIRGMNAEHDATRALLVEEQVARAGWAKRALGLQRDLDAERAARTKLQERAESAEEQTRPIGEWCQEVLRIFDAAIEAHKKEARYREQASDARVPIHESSTHVFNALQDVREQIASARGWSGYERPATVEDLERALDWVVEWGALLISREQDALDSAIRVIEGRDQELRAWADRTTQAEKECFEALEAVARLNLQTGEDIVRLVNELHDVRAELVTAEGRALSWQREHGNVVEAAAELVAERDLVKLQRDTTARVALRLVAKRTEEVDALRAAAQPQRKALEAVLQFHCCAPWDDAASASWRELTGDDDASTRGLCNAVRRALGRDETER